jgi:uncharacterized protein
MLPDTRLRELLAGFPSVLVGFSGGVDSAVLAVVARQVLGRSRAVAALGVAPSLAQDQREQAVNLAQQFDLDLVLAPTDELSDPGYVANAPSRCYFCKRELWAKLSAVAQERGLAVLADGTNAEDLGEHRPGLGAAREFGVRSPLAEAGYTKADVRRLARALELPIWNAPAAPCLASRIMYGLSVTPLRLRQVEAGERILRSLGVEGDLRVRHRGEEARIEVAPSAFERVRTHREQIARAFRTLGFARVTLDLLGYRRGSLLVSGEPPLEVLAEFR